MPGFWRRVSLIPVIPGVDTTGDYRLRRLRYFVTRRSVRAMFIVAGRLRPLGLLAEVAIVDVTDRDRAARERAAEPAGELQGGAGLQRRIDRFQIGGAGIAGSSRGRVRHLRRGDDLARALEAEAHRH